MAVSPEEQLPPKPAAAPEPVPPPVPAAKPTVERGRRLPRTRISTAWVSIVSALVLLILLVVFIAQNAHPVDVSFLMLHGRFPLAVALLAAVAGGALIAVIGGTLRMVQLRRAVPRRKAAPAPVGAAPAPVRPPEPGPAPGPAPEPAKERPQE
ncbi:lipopolysaccharide assembly protein LapA domain-containing protein [Streptacidiphilus sp. N1-12]|uniref:Lipopolysaccharide assembly protein LapA domain-containing protein n=2 Tax=Streptacidiphilus alkalitolerans TaxID=3342712 RepID=A0ABV6WLX0_9ACTN